MTYQIYAPVILDTLSAQPYRWVPIHRRSPLDGRRLRQLRKAAGLSQPRLAITAGLSVSAVTDIEQGVTTNPKLSTLEALAQTLGVDVADLLVEPEPEGVAS